MSKITARIRRSLKTKAIQKINRNGNLRPRLVVNRSSRHFRAQIMMPGEKGDLVVVSSSTLDKELRASLTGTKVEQARQVGKLLGERAKEKEISDVAFDRAGYKYHGRVKALADGAREAGLNF
jgi:large subunit ribosomal protein L18